MTAPRRAATIALLSYLGFAAPTVTRAQEHVSINGSLLFYGDNTEFSTFRDGDTLFGTAIRLYGAADLTDHVTVRLGAAGNYRFGGDEAFEIVRPLVALVVSGARSRVVFGSLETTDVRVPRGPDRGGPHGLLPPLQRETLSFERPFEAGLQWTFTGSRLRHETWINWQQVNTPAHRERFDVGLAAEWNVTPLVGLALQGHVVHHGGQLFATGPVADSYAVAPGIVVRGAPGRLKQLSIELLGLASRYVPDRADAARSRSGAGVFARAEASTEAWRGHLIVWRGNDCLKEEGDANYLSVRTDGSRYRDVRDYSEVGLARFVRPAPGVTIEISARFYRIEPHNYEYSYRVLALTNLRWLIR